jgi:putative transposase
MPDYRRNLIPGATYFFTVNLADRRSNLLVAEVDHLRAAVARTRTLHPFTIDAWVVLPDHMHAVWTLPVHDTDFSTRWATIKRLFSTSVPPTEHRSASRRKQASAAFGNDASGSIRSVMRGILPPTSITSTSIP